MQGSAVLTVVGSSTGGCWNSAARTFAAGVNDPIRNAPTTTSRQSRLRKQDAVSLPNPTPTSAKQGKRIFNLLSNQSLWAANRKVQCLFAAPPRTRGFQDTLPARPGEYPHPQFPCGVDHSRVSLKQQLQKKRRRRIRLQEHHPPATITLHAPACRPPAYCHPNLRQ